TLACIIGIVGGAIVWRLLKVDNQLRQDLIDTAQAEVTALRIGNFANYMDIQRSASDAFIFEQEQAYANYQLLKQAGRIQLTGDVLDVEIDENRGRVILREIIDGIPYKVMWFYWFYEEGGSSNQIGWRRVPDDLTFWGNEREIETDRVQVDYRTLDSLFAETLAKQIESWITAGCAELDCVTLPPQMTIKVVAERPARIAWSSADYWTLIVTSPYVERARADVAIAPEREAEIAREIAGRLLALRLNYGTLPQNSDAVWLYDDFARWLGNALRDEPQLGFMESLIALYGANAPQAVLTALPTASTLDSAVTVMLGAPLSALPVEQIAALDWRSYFQWRLDLESRILMQPGTGNLLDLYDLNDIYAAGEAARRQEDAAYAALPAPQVQRVDITRDAESQTYAYVEVIQPDAGTTSTIIWRLTDGTWKRRS
ncbi:MAG: hypothetical protein JXA10_07350, partial [Anaerolineae bacterium]|nr:hypothetical protein [Anaerolineae bacterium]